MHAKKSIAVAASVALALAGCATASKDIATSYVSPNQYASYDCAQLAAEAGRIQARVVQLGGRLDQAATNDAGIMAVGLILFWPVLFALGGTKQQEAEYARLKGEYDAVEQMAVQKKCAHTLSGAQAAAATPATRQGDAAPPPVTAEAGANAASGASAAAPAPQPVQVAAAAVPPVGVVSKYTINAERFAKDNGCTGAAATMNIRAATYETFTVACAGGDPRSIRCDDGVCRELR